MKLFSLWIDELEMDEADESGLTGADLFGHPFMMIPDQESYEGPVLVVGSGLRKTFDVRFAHLHVGSRSNFCWHLRPFCFVRPPFLLTNDIDTEVVFEGPINTDFKGQSQSDVLVVAEGWHGVVTGREYGLFGQRSLIAFSSVKETKLQGRLAVRVQNCNQVYTIDVP